MKVSAVVQNVALLAVGLLVAVAAGEILIRYVAPQPMYRFPRGMYVEDPVLKYRLASNFSGVARTGEYRTEIHTNSLGLREQKEYAVPKPADTFRILAVGDSFTMGVGVQLEDSWVKVLERSLATNSAGKTYEVINAGVPGYDTSQEVAYLRGAGAVLAPDLVLVNFFLGNDVNDNYRKPREYVARGYLMEGDEPQGLLSADARIFLQRNVQLYHFLFPYWHQLTHPETQAQARAKQDFFLSIYAAQDDTQTSAMWQATWSQLQQLAQLAQERSLKIAVVIIPDRLQVDTNAWKEVEKAGSAPNRYRFDAPDQKMLARCAQLGIPALDLLPALRAADRSSDTYYELDGHWTVKGNAVAAAAILEFLRARRLIDDRHDTALAPARAMR